MYVSIGLHVVQNWKKILLGLTLIFTLIFMFFLNPFEQKQNQYGGIGGVATVSPLVMRYEPLVTLYAQKYGVEQHVQLLLAKIMQESGGRLPDVMQSSESLGLPRNSITDPEVSIDAGVRYFASVLQQSNGDVLLALQSYNFGAGFIPYAQERGGYSKEVAVAFSSMMASKMGWSRYGDVDYVDNVMRYLNGASGGSAGAVNAYGFVKPVNGEITSPFGYRIHPITGLPKMHGGVDYGCQKQPIPIYATKAGTVTSAGWENPSNHSQGYGQRIYVDHGGGLESRYAHLSQMMVMPGQTVTQGQQIGLCGTTGSSTGMHLHFELLSNGAKIDPVLYVN